MIQCDRIIENISENLTLQGPHRPRTGSEMRDLAILEDSAIAIINGIITDVGPTAEIRKKYHSDMITSAKGKVVMPGFVDPHTHPVFVHTRENEFEMRVLGKSYVEISRSGGGIRSSIRSVQEIDEDRLYELSLPRVKRLISQGTTTLEAKSGYGLTTESEMKMLRVIRRLSESLPVEIVPTFLGAHEFPEEYKNDHERYIRILENEMLPAVAESGLAKYCDIFTEKHVYSVPESRRVLARARELGFELRMHADEIEPIGGAELAAEMNAVTADHLGAASDKGIQALKEAGVIPVLLPGTIFSLGLSSYARARDMIDAGLPVTLATDYNPGSCNCDSMQFVITLATLQMKMTVAEAITASTINGAWSLGAGDRTGSIEPGKQADLLILDMPSYRFLPYHFGSNNVQTVIKKGKIIYSHDFA